MKEEIKVIAEKFKKYLEDHNCLDVVVVDMS